MGNYFSSGNTKIELHVGGTGSAATHATGELVLDGGEETLKKLITAIKMLQNEGAYIVSFKMSVPKGSFYSPDDKKVVALAKAIKESYTKKATGDKLHINACILDFSFDPATADAHSKLFVFHMAMILDALGARFGDKKPALTESLSAYKDLFAQMDTFADMIEKK